jgi:DnaK suppressor protein
MTDLAQLRQGFVQRLSVLGHRVDEFEDTLREPLEADFSEQATQMEGADVTSELERNAILEAEQIKAAILRIDAGKYGACVSCDKAINPKRLEALPYATICIECVA